MLSKDGSVIYIGCYDGVFHAVHASGDDVGKAFWSVIIGKDKNAESSNLPPIPSTRSELSNVHRTACHASASNASIPPSRRNVQQTMPQQCTFSKLLPPSVSFSFYNRKFNIKAKVDGAATLSPDGASLYFGAQNGALYKLDAVNGNKVR